MATPAEILQNNYDISLRNIAYTDLSNQASSQREHMVQTRLVTEPYKEIQGSVKDLQSVFKTPADVQVNKQTYSTQDAVLTKLQELSIDPIVGKVATV